MPEPLTDETLAAVLVHGPRPTRVTLVDYDPRWPGQFAHEPPSCAACSEGAPGSSSTSALPPSPAWPPNP